MRDVDFCYSTVCTWLYWYVLEIKKKKKKKKKNLLFYEFLTHDSFLLKFKCWKLSSKSEFCDTYKDWKSLRNIACKRNSQHWKLKDTDLLSL